MKISEVHTLFNGVVMSFVMNIGENLHLLSLRCCCLYFKRNLPQLLCFFGQKLLYLPIINFVICHILRILQLCLFMHTIAPVPSVVRSLQFRKSQRKFPVYNPEGCAWYQTYPLCPPLKSHAIIKHLQKSSDHEQCHVNQISYQT